MASLAGVCTFPSAPKCIGQQRQLAERAAPRPAHSRRLLAAPAATAVAATVTPNANSAGRQSRHFLRPSLLATGLAQPEHVLQHMLALFRKADLAALRQYLPDAYSAALAAPPPEAAAPEAGGSGSSSSSSSSSSSYAHAAPPLPVGPWLTVAEAGPLACLAGVLDVGARRVLPGHLLRRSQVLSTLRPAPDAFQQRISLTARTGETSVFDWLLRWHPHDEEGTQPAAAGQPADPSSSRSSGSSGSGSQAGGRWVLESVRRDASADLPPPATPHPKAAPEAIVRAQLAALAAGDAFGACCFSSWERGQLRGHLGSRRTGLAYHHEALRAKLAAEPYNLLLGHAVAQLGAAALPSQREMLQAVSVLAPDGASARFLWRLALGSQGCWMVTGIFSEADMAEEGWQQRPHI